MNFPISCIHARTEIDALLATGAALSPEVRTHLDQCSLCRHRHADAELQWLLQRHAVPSPSPGFADSAIRCAIEQEPVARTGGRPGTLRLTALAASLAVFAMILSIWTVTRMTSPSPVGIVADLAMAPPQVKTVRVLLESSKQRDNATITISLAENLELEGFPNDRIIEWDSALKEGRNLLTLPLRVLNGVNSHFDVAFMDGETHKHIRVELSAVDPPPIA